MKISGTLRLKSIEPSHLHCLAVSVQCVFQRGLKTVDVVSKTKYLGKAEGLSQLNVQENP